MKTITKFHYDSVNKNLYANIDGNVVPIIKGSGVTRVASLPATGESGKIYYNESDRQYYTYDSSTGAFSTLGANTGYPVENMGKYGAPFFLGDTKYNILETPEYKESIANGDFFKDNLTFTAVEFTEVINDHLLGKYGLFNINYKNIDGNTLAFSCFDCKRTNLQGEYFGFIYDITIAVNTGTISIKRRDIEPDVIYYFPRYGLWLRFEHSNVSTNIFSTNIFSTYIPVIVNVERTLSINTLCIEDDNPRTVLQVNEYICYVRTEDNGGINLDTTLIGNIPGGNLIDVCGRFLVPRLPFQIRLLSWAAGYNLADSNPPLLAGHTYEYHIFDRVLSYVDVTVTNTEQVER